MAKSLISAEVEIKGLEELRADLEKVPQAANQHLASAMGYSMAAIAEQGETTMMASAKSNLSSMHGFARGGGGTPLAPANQNALGGMLKAQVKIGGLLDITGRVFASSGKQFYLALIELGRPAGSYPPVRALQEWAQDVLGVDEKNSKAAGRALAKAIGQRGIEPTPALEKAAEEASGKVNAEFEKALDAIAREVAK